jgi:hypothetical protein
MFAKVLSRFWWMILIRGVLSVLFGVMVFAWPGISLLSLVLLFGAFILADGFGNVVTAIGGRHEHENWWVLLLGGLAAAALGVLTFFNPGSRRSRFSSNRHLGHRHRPPPDRRRHPASEGDRGGVLDGARRPRLGRVRNAAGGETG